MSDTPCPHVMRITVCPDAFKGTLSSPGVAAAISKGLSSSPQGAVEVYSSPMSDGGHGLLDCLMVCTSQDLSDTFMECFADTGNLHTPLTPPYPRGLPVLLGASCSSEAEVLQIHSSLDNDLHQALWNVRGRYLVRRSERYAVVEMAEVGGLPQVEAASRQWLSQHVGDTNSSNDMPVKDSRKASSYAVGELLNRIGEDWSSTNIKEIFIGLGGSSTNDCGMGMLQALGVEIYVRGGVGETDAVVLQTQPIVASELANIDHINCDTDKFVAFLKRWWCTDSLSSSLGIHVVCDVSNPLLGPSGATAVYGPQKLGLFDENTATPEMKTCIQSWKTSVLMELENGATRCQDVLDDALRKIATKKGVTKKVLCCGSAAGAGAAGGIGAALLGFIAPFAQMLIGDTSTNSLQPPQALPSGAEILQGPKFTNVANLVKQSHVVITGEGAFDRQTIEFGKTVASIYKALLNQHQRVDNGASTTPLPTLSLRRTLVIIICGVADTTEVDPNGTICESAGWSNWDHCSYAKMFTPMEDQYSASSTGVDIVVVPLTGFRVPITDPTTAATSIQLSAGYVPLRAALNDTAAVITRLVHDEVVPNVIAKWRAA